MTTAMNIVHFILTMWYVNDKFYRFVSLVKEECRKKEKKENK